MSQIWISASHFAHKSILLGWTLIGFTFCLSVFSHSAIANHIVIENQLSGTPIDVWNASFGRRSELDIKGFATEMSVVPGETIDFKISTVSTDYQIEIYRLGYYNGDGARLVDTITPSAALPQPQPPCIEDASVGLVDCGNWGISGSWDVPANATSGVYLANFVRNDIDEVSRTVFIVRDDTRNADVLFLAPDTTWQAYNSYGGYSFYTSPRAKKLSYNRPFDNEGRDWVLNAVYPMVRWLESNGYDVSYAAGSDIDRDGPELLNHRVFLSAGHDEYWSGNQRSNVETARDAGVNLAFFSGNEVFWKTRWESSIDGNSDPYRTLVCYKETHENAITDPHPTEWTGTWRDPRFSPPKDGGRPENQLTGTSFSVNATRADSITVPSDFSALRFWRNTDIVNLTAGQSATFPQGTLGFEWDTDPDNGFRPRGLMRLSRTTVSVPDILVDYGNSYAPGDENHYLTMYRALSGALVFGAGTIQWSWGLDANSPFNELGDTTDLRIQQSTTNLFADMGIQPESLQTGLVLATASTDNQSPTSSVDNPLNGSDVNIQIGASVQIVGTASDLGGGVVAGVEISLDGGQTWHPTEGRENWSYTWTPLSSGIYTILASAVDDSGNIETSPTSNTITVFIDGSDNLAPTITTRSPSPNASNISVGTVVTAQFDEAMDPTSLVFELRDFGATLVPSTVSYDSTTNTATLTPIAALAEGVSYTATVVNATDLVGNPLLSAPDSWSFTTGSIALGPCPCSIWDNTFIPSIESASDTNAVELGMKFQADQDGFINALRFYKGPTNTGIHTGSLWASDGTLLAQVTFQNETASGWQEQALDSPVAIVANTSYVVSYHAPNGGYAKDTSFFSTGGVTNSLLRALADGEDGGNGLYNYGPTSQFPSSTYLSSNYWVDVVYDTSNEDLLPPSVITRSPTPDATGISVSTVVTAQFDEAIDPTNLVFELRDIGAALVSATVSYDSTTNTATLTPSSALFPNVPYTATVVSAADLAGNPMSTPDSWSFMTYADVIAPSIITRTPTPGATDISVGSVVTAQFDEAIDTTSLVFELRDIGAALVPATVSYDSTTNTAILMPIAALAEGVSYTATVVSATDLVGNPLLSAPDSWSFTTFADIVAPSITTYSPTPNATGISVGTVVTAQFDEAINTTSLVFELRDLGATLVPSTVSYDNTTNTATLTPIAALLEGVSYTATVANATDLAGNPLLGAPDSWSFTTYADVFAPSITTYSPAPNATGISVATVVTAQFDEAMDPTSLVFELRDLGAVLVPATVSYDSVTNTATLMPIAALAEGVSYTATVVSATDLVGNPLLSAPDSWSFTTGSLPIGPCPCSIWDNTFIPSIESAGDTNSVELGMKFQADQDGFINALRFYKGPTNTGIHTGSLWASDGTLLAQVTFQNETASGWQEQALLTPVAITANTRYVVSYHAPNGGYAKDVGFFSAGGVTNTLLRALADGEEGGNGLYNYGPTSQFPSSTYASSNYWVDVVYDTSNEDILPPMVITRSPASGATGISVSTLVTAQFDEAIDPTSLVFELRDLGAVQVPATVSYDSVTNTATLTPTSALFANVPYTATVVSAADLAGNPLGAPDSWSFTTYADVFAPSITTRSPTPGAADISIATVVTAQFDEAMDPTSLVFELRDLGATLVPATVSYDSTTNTATLTPIAALAEGVSYTATVVSATDLVGNPLLSAPDSWSFTSATLPAGPCPCSIWDDSVIPTEESASDTNSVELGMKFQATQDGYINALRFYKGPSNTGVHVGSLWASDGTLLAQVTFQNETVSGWQAQVLDSPVAIIANATYVVSYHAPNGGYARDREFFAAGGVDSGLLRALADGEDGENGLYVYGPTSQFPVSTYLTTNYWVDVVFNTQ